MAGSSTFPRVIDTDDVLYRVDADSLLIPAMHNNHVDALQSLELSLGVADDGTGSGITPAVNTGALHYGQFPSVAMPNPRYPFASIDARSIYGNDDGSLASWTLGAGVSAAWDKPAGWLRLSVPNTANFLVASVTLPAEALMWAVLRARIDNLAEPGIAFGFSINGTGSDLDGPGCYSNGSGGIVARKVENGTRATGGTVLTQYTPQHAVYFRWDGSTVSCWSSEDGQCFFTPTYAITSRGTPTKFCVYTTHAPTAASFVWLSMLAFGWANPATFFAS